MLVLSIVMLGFQGGKLLKVRCFSLVLALGFIGFLGVKKGMQLISKRHPSA